MTRREIRPLAASRRSIPVTRGATYTLSCEARASREGVPCVLGIVQNAPGSKRKEHRQELRLTTGWKRYSLTFRTTERYLFVVAGPNLEKEERVDVDLDAVQLERSDTATEFQPHDGLELAIEPSAFGGVFVDDAGGALWLRASNDGAAPAPVTVKFHVTDFADQPVAWPDRSLIVPAHAAIQDKVPFPSAWKGFYRVTASAESAGVRWSAQLPLAIVPPKTRTDTV